jgi:hypothetical protein
MHGLGRACTSRRNRSCGVSSRLPGPGCGRCLQPCRGLRVVAASGARHAARAHAHAETLPAQDAQATRSGHGRARDERACPQVRRPARRESPVQFKNSTPQTTRCRQRLGFNGPTLRKRPCDANCRKGQRWQRPSHWCSASPIVCWKAGSASREEWEVCLLEPSSGRRGSCPRGKIRGWRVRQPPRAWAHQPNAERV